MAGAPTLEDRAFLALIGAVSLAFAWILWPLFGAVLWGVILAIVFAPPYRRLLKSMRQRRTLAALATLGMILVLVILPLTLLTALLVQEGTAVYERIQSGEFDIGRYFQQTFNALPGAATGLLDRFGLTNLGLVEERLSAALKKSSQFFAGQALNLGQNTLNFVLSLFVMLYLNSLYQCVTVAEQKEQSLASLGHHFATRRRDVPACGLGTFRVFASSRSP